MVVTEGFLTGAPWNPKFTIFNPGYLLDPPTVRQSNSTIQRLLKDVKALERLDNAKCMELYHSWYLTGRRNVLAVSSEGPVNGSSVLAQIPAYLPVYTNYLRAPFIWQCSWPPEDYPGKGLDGYDLKDALKNATSWQVLGYPIDYCLSEVAEDHCKLQLSRTIMIAVVICNLVKFCCMICLISRNWGKSLVTTG